MPVKPCLHALFNKYKINTKVYGEHNAFSNQIAIKDLLNSNKLLKSVLGASVSQINILFVLNSLAAAKKT